MALEIALPWHSSALQCTFDKPKSELERSTRGKFVSTDIQGSTAQILFQFPFNGFMLCRPEQNRFKLAKCRGAAWHRDSIQASHPATPGLKSPKIVLLNVMVHSS